jgi:phospholipid N-methyltransferase
MELRAATRSDCPSTFGMPSAIEPRRNAVSAPVTRLGRDSVITRETMETTSVQDQNPVSPRVAHLADASAHVSRPRRFGLFAKNFIQHPTSLGTLFPSSRFLVRRALSDVDWDASRVIVEYGPGVGHFTQGILDRMRRDAQLIAIEINAEFVAFLRTYYPDRRLRVVEGSAAAVRPILERAGCPQADCILAGIPFSTFPVELTREILLQTHAALSDGGTLVVYQVSSAVLPHLRSIFRRVECRFEPLNLVPTRLYLCSK